VKVIFRVLIPLLAGSVPLCLSALPAGIRGGPVFSLMVADRFQSNHGTMAHRSFRDEEGREWDVWEVVPTALERRMARQHPPTKGIPDRRKLHEPRVLVPDELQKGWLAFQWDHERRRLTPIPEDWTEMTSDELLKLLHRADRRIRPRRLVE
jgi:hypothetical protein